MKNSIFYIIGFAMFIGCKAIDNIEPSQKDTFLKVYGETNITLARDLLITDDGYVILGTIGSIVNEGDNTTILFKTDLLGNKIWGSLYQNFRGRSIVEVDDGYIIVGDSIDDTNQPYMNLLKTDLEGNSVTSVTPQGSPNSFGYAITYTSDNEVVALGNTYNSQTSASLVLMGYKSNLTEAWSEPPKEYGLAGQINVPYPSIYETTQGDLAWASAAIGSSAVTIKSSIAKPDSGLPDAGSSLFNGETITNTTFGGMAKLPVGYAVTQNVSVGSESKIGVSIFDQNLLEENILSDNNFLNGNYIPTAITNTPNGLLIAAYTDQHEGSDTQTRNDYDLFVVEVGYNGKVKEAGIKNTFGGLGNESPVRIHNTEDGGYLILGNLINTKGAEQIFLLKINSKGELN